MDKETGSPLSDSVEVIDGTITRRQTLHEIQHRLGVSDRQSRAAVSSYSAEGWLLPCDRLNAPLTMVGSLDARLAVHESPSRHHAIKAENGKRGGRPPKV